MYTYTFNVLITTEETFYIDAETEEEAEKELEEEVRWTSNLIDYDVELVEVRKKYD
jgi:hypothetical protein